MRRLSIPIQLNLAMKWWICFGIDLHLFEAISHHQRIAAAVAAWRALEMFDLKLKFRRYPYIIAWVSFRLSKWDITFIQCGDLGRARHRHRRMRRNQSGAKHGHCAAYSHHRKPLIALDLHARRWSSHPFGHRITMKVFLCCRPTGAWELHTKSNKKKKRCHWTIHSSETNIEKNCDDSFTHSLRPLKKLSMTAPIRRASLRATAAAAAAV